MQYNSSQLKAIEHGGGPALVLAGPGSGKTAVITGRTVRLIQNGISPSSILVVTFTRAAAAEMKERFLKMTGRSASPVTFGTFHGIFYGILKNTYRISGSNILADARALQLLREILEHTCPDTQEADLPSSVAREISQVKGSRMDISHFYSGVLPTDAFRKVFRAYENWKRDNRMLDFDDIITRCYELLTTRQDILSLWQQKFRYILVDEFQDISPLQYEIIRLLAFPENNLFIVGDDDQSIYRFRGANPDLMLNFPKVYPGCQVIALEENYRSTPEILKAAENLICHNRKRFRKNILSSSPSGSPVSFECFDNPRKECVRMAQQIREAHDRGVPYEETAVLFRTNVGCRQAVEQLMAYQIPFRMGDVIPCVFDHWIAKDVMAYMDLGAMSRERRGKRSDFLRVYNRPNRYFSREAFYDPLVTYESLYSYYEDKDWMVRRVDELETNLTMIRHLAPYGALNYIRREIGYEGYLRDYAMQRNIPPEDLLQVLDELTESARNYRTCEEWKASIEKYREKLKQQRALRSEEHSGVVVSTLHASKGMEYDTVYILDVNEGIIPYHKAVLDADLEEERRMLYVGMTRARKDLYIYSVRERYDKKIAPSRFLREIEAGLTDTARQQT
ncbi:ATP-dependent helicase [Bilifractor sp. HCP3S3_D3]|uniref:ATP-dependent helicase n=1 Tax=Bilifractor sp. HCP3S3_D3 TaxID=3438907 RepID=UPI003F8C0F8E